MKSKLKGYQNDWAIYKLLEENQVPTSFSFIIKVELAVFCSSFSRVPKSPKKELKHK